MVKTELPFVVGVMADLSGQPKEKLPALKQRKVVSVDRDNFNSVLEKAAPRVAMKVDNKISGDGKLGVELNFKHIDDFEPARVAEQVAPLRELLEMRQRLTQLMSKMEGNDKLEELLGQVLNSTEAAKKTRRADGDRGPEGIVRSKRGSLSNQLHE